jgi:curved DNA binding protein
MISKMLAQVAKDFQVELVGGIVSHQMERFNIDGEKVIVNKPDLEQRPDVVQFEPHEVYAIDILYTTGEGRVHEVDNRTTVFKRAVDETYKLKLKASRTIFSEINKRFPTFPFTLRELDSKTARFGIKECVDHGLVTSYPVLCEKNGEFVAHMKFTALVLPNQTQRITGVPLEAARYQSEKALSDEDLKKLLATSASGGASKKKKKKKKAEGAAAAGDAGAAEADDGGADAAEPEA